MAKIEKQKTKSIIIKSLPVDGVSGIKTIGTLKVPTKF